MLRFFKPEATDENWEYFGKKCPYYGVVSWERFRPESFDAQAKTEFFETGEKYIGRLFEVIAEKVQADFKPRRPLDFGCGVGRLLIPLAKRCGTATGIDVSPSMRKEAETNCRQAGFDNISLSASVEELLAKGAKFDFINSFIVFQHIPPKRGYLILAQLLQLVEEGGIGALHFTYSSPTGKRGRIQEWSYRKFPLVYGFSNLFHGRKFSEPRMDMAEYSLSRIFAMLQENGCDDCHTRFTFHGVRGVVIIFKKARLAAI